jgi:hypothetical protein
MVVDVFEQEPAQLDISRASGLAESGKRFWVTPRCLGGSNPRGFDAASGFFDEVLYGGVCQVPNDLALESRAFQQRVTGKNERLGFSPNWQALE